MHQDISLYLYAIPPNPNILHAFSRFAHINSKKMHEKVEILETLHAILP